MARGKRALLIALLLASLLLVALGATARELWLEAREVEIDLHEEPVVALAPLGSDTVVCARLDGTIEAVKVPGGELSWKVRVLAVPVAMVARDGFVAVGVNGAVMCFREGRFVTGVALAEGYWYPESVSLLPSRRPGGARLAWLVVPTGGHALYVRELTGEPDERIGQATQWLAPDGRMGEAAQWLAVTENRLFALGAAEGLFAVDPWTLVGEKAADAEPTILSHLVAGPRGVAWEQYHALHLWRPGSPPARILEEDELYPVAFDDSGELLATVLRKAGWPFLVRLYDLEREKWWSCEILDPAAVAFVGDRIVIGDNSGKLHVLPTPRVRFQRSWKPLER
jgi:hypothetical protein